ncbi:hypothetical protein JOD69_000258 [Methylocaldum sp. RMAD-M]|jgi:hypothetical protein|nr:hypothetical protein [Methylocaldum sp. RMAD-M]
MQTLTKLLYIKNRLPLNDNAAHAKRHRRLISGEQRKWIDSSTPWKIEAIVKVARRSASVTRIPYVTQKIAWPYDIPYPDRCHTFEMSVIVNLTAGPQHRDDIPA